jgi:hypothetical protein
MENERVNLLAVLDVLRNRGIITDEDMKTVDSSSRLAATLIANGIFTDSELRSSSTEIMDLVGRVVACLSSQGDLEELINSIRGTYGSKYAGLLRYLEEIHQNHASD